MDNANRFREKMLRGEVCLGTGISFTDATISEALSEVLDFVWIDTEHGALSLDTVQSHVIATRAAGVTALVRVPWNDPVLIKPVLDLGADGVIVPLIRNAEDVRLAVSACRYPPEGIRGYGPRRPSRYGALGGADFCRQSNQTVITIVQIEHDDAVRNLDEILAVPGLTGVVVGCNDLASSMGVTGEPRHPKVLSAIEAVIEKSRSAGVFVGIAIGTDVVHLREWVDKGMQWLAMGTDFMFMLQTAKELCAQLRGRTAR